MTESHYPTYASVVILITVCLNQVLFSLTSYESFYNLRIFIDVVNPFPPFLVLYD